MIRAALFALVLLAAPSFAQDVPPPVRTQHAGTFNGQEIRYTAIVGETVLRDNSGKPVATIFSTSYVRDGADAKKRPVLFAFNGGPGASSSPLHMSAFGPKRSSNSTDAPKPGEKAPRAPEGEPKLADNPYSLLSDTDLVFIDPVGAGFSRVFPDADGQPYWGVKGDGQAVLEFIRSWLAANGRQDSPKFICGESYGGTRLGAILNEMGDLKLDGALFISPLLDSTLSAGDQGYVFLVPSMAVTAAFHKKADARGRTPNRIFDDAAAFAQSDYVVALQKGVRLPQPERARVGKRLAALLGLPADYVLAKNLRITREDFYSKLLADKGERTGQLDGRYTGNAAEYAAKRPPYNDPGLAGSGGSSGNILPKWLTEDLKFDAGGRKYVGLSLEINSKWDWPSSIGRNTYPSALASIGKAMKANPALRIYLGGGLYDMSTPVLAGRYAMDHADVTLDRITIDDFESGHSMYSNEASLKKLNDDVRAFVRAGVPR